MTWPAGTSVHEYRWYHPTNLDEACIRIAVHVPPDLDDTHLHLEIEHALEAVLRHLATGVPNEEVSSTSTGRRRP